MLNLSVMIKQSEDPVSIQTVYDVLSNVCVRVTEPEAIFRCFVAIGTLLTLKNPPKSTASINNYIELMASSSEPSKILSCCKHLMNIIKK